MQTACTSLRALTSARRSGSCGGGNDARERVNPIPPPGCSRWKGRAIPQRKTRYTAASQLMSSLLHHESRAGGSISSSNKKIRKKFGATAPQFIDYLKEILRRYPDGGQILKELLQNADDAEANEVVFIFDERTYGSTTLFVKDLKKFQGPALIVYNDSVFSEEDWHSIQTTGTSNKRNDPSKVGQFGLGFNTIYHITDVPSIFSGKYIGIFDPQQKLFGEQEAGYIWTLDDPEDRNDLEHSSDQFRSFKYAMEAIGTTTWSNALKENYFKGTLFRFPLRTEPSEILATLYDRDKIFDLFDSFRADEDMNLLFLRNVATVSIKHIDTDGNVKVLSKTAALQPEHFPSFNWNLNGQNQELFSKVKSSTCIRAVSQYFVNEKHHNHWLITNCTGIAGEWGKLDDLAERLGYTPCVGLAFPLNKVESSETSAKTGFEGRLSFFLPLPNNEANKTGLPVHVNASFGLSDNRRHIKWIESDQRYDEAAQWNELLIEKILPYAYSQLILDAITLAKASVLKPFSVYHIWPDLEKMNRKDRWVNIAKEITKRLMKLNTLCLASCEDNWITAGKAIFLQCCDRPDMRQAIENVLIKESQPLVRVPVHVFKALEFASENQSDLNIITPAYLRNILQHCDLNTLPYEQKLLLLEYVLSDEQYSSLNNLALLPLTNGSFVRFQISSCDEPVFTDSAKFPRILLPGLEERFLPEELCETLLDHLKKIAYSQIFANVICLDANTVRQYIWKALPETWSGTFGPVTWDILNRQHPPEHWLAEFWNFLNNNCKTLDKFEGLPLIPLNSLKDCANSIQLAHLSKNITTIFQMQTGYNLPGTIASIITRAGGSIVQSTDEFLKHQQLSEYVFLPSPNNVLKVFLNLGCDQVVKEIDCMSTEDRRSLRSFLAEASIFETDEINMLFKLPIFQQMTSLRPSDKGFITAGPHGALSNDVYPEIPDDVPLPETVLKCVDENDRKLLLMKGKLLTAADVALLMLKGVETQKYEPEQIEKWVPCNTCPKTLTEHRKVKINFYKLENVRDLKYANIVGLVMPLTDKFIEKAGKILGLLNLPPAEKVVENLLLMVNQISNSDLDLSCYVKKVPQEIAQYRELLLECGVKNGYSNNEVIQILYKLRDNAVKMNTGCGSPSELKTVISILDWMRRNNFSPKSDLPVPVWKGTQDGFCLKPCSKAVLCDLDKGTMEAFNKRDENIHILHKDISLAIIEWLNVPPLSSKMLQSELIGIEQYGQVEPIVLRIKNILKEYDQEHDLFKEMLQNAEDAGSTVCSFLVDMRQHKDSPESLIDPGMASCHGPALWSYNNECFTDEDFHNITRIGTASKEKQVDKIGKFGLGFNSVYHITDVPSILSGKYLLIFDPNVTHLKKYIHSVTNPGIKLNLYEHRRLIQKFPGQFNPYNGIFGCNFKISTGENFYYEGTLIKLPFRTPEEAAVSGISSKYYNQKHIMSLVDSFKQTSKDLIIFLKNVRKVSLKFVNEHSVHENQLISVFKMERQILNIIEMADNFPLKKMQENAINIMESTNKFSRKIRSLRISTIIQVTEETIDNPSHRKYWLVHTCFGMAKALQFSCSKATNTYFAPPLGSVAIPLKKKKETGHWTPNTEAQVGQVFCFLPLSLQCGLPVHINGTFAVTSNRKNLWSSGAKGEWNQALLEDAVSAAYITSISLMQQMSQKGEFEDYDYYTFWPNVKNVDNQFRVIVENFYRAIAHGINGVRVKAFSNGQDWGTINHARFLDSSIVENKRVGEIAITEFSKYLSKPLISVTLPDWVRQGFVASGFGHLIEQNTYTWESFYKEIVFQNLTTLSPNTRNVLIIYAIDMRDASIDEMLVTKPCIPSSGKRGLQYIKNLVHPEGKVACLYDEEEGRFPLGHTKDFLHPERLLRLEMLGMVKGRIAFLDLIERAETIEKIWPLERNKAYQRVRHILDLLKDLNEVSDEDLQTLQSISFLPAFLPHSWEKDNTLDAVVLQKAKDVYSCKYYALVSMMEMVLDKELLKGIKLSAEAISYLGLNKQPPVEIVLEQLKQAYVRNSLTINELKRLTKECYFYLNKQLKGDSELKNTIFNAAQEFPFILVHGQFVPVELVACKVSFDAAPYLYELPKEYIECEELWKCLEIKVHFKLQDYVSVLTRMSEKYSGTRLSDSDLAVCLRIVTTGFAEASEQEDILQNVLLPNQHCVLHSAQTLQYNDTPWLVVGDDVNLCHSQIARETAIRFHVQTTKHSAMKNLQVKDLSLWAREFGQQEKLTVRLKNIIKAYPSKKDILKELIQNADDAEASEIHFIWDPRKHGNTKTFGEEWNALQGPALCVYNDKKFTDKDIEGIQQLGEGGKRNSPEKTGKYGLGFNSVYHLTDCPSFISGDSMLCIFDPHLAMLGTAKPHSPGGMFTVNQKFKNTFEDVYTTFLPTFFNLELGTMFRLPVRTAEMAEKSDISKQAVTKDVILELLEVLKEDSDSLLLFLNNIKKIGFHKVDKKTSDLHEIFTAEVEMALDSIAKQECLKHCIQRCSNYKTAVSKMEFHQVIYEMEIRSSVKNPTRWILANQVGIHEAELTESVQSFCLKLGHPFLPRSSVAACINCSNFQGKAFCFLPLPIETGLPVHINGNFAVDFARRDLWKQDGQSGKMKWNNFLKLHLIAPLYADLLDYIRIHLLGTRVGPLKSDSLELCLNVIEPSYLCFFPHVSEEVPQEWQLMINQVYKCIDQKSLCLIPIAKRENNKFCNEKNIINIFWSSLSKEKRDEVPHFVTTHITVKLVEILEDIGMNLVLQSNVMHKVLKSLQRACLEVSLLNPGAVRKFLQIHPLNNAEVTNSNYPFPLSESLIKDGARCVTLLDYCLSDVKEGNYNVINHLPLLITQDNMLGKFKRTSPKYITKFHDLFPEFQPHFANYDVNKRYKDLLTTALYLEDFTISRAEQFIRNKLGYRFQINSTDPHSWLKFTENEQHSEWLKKLWKYFESQVKYDDDTENTFNNFKLIFSDLAILPVVCPIYHDQCLLAPVGALNSVICEMTQTSIAQILLKLGFAKIAADYFSMKVLFNCIRPHSLRTDDKASILQHLRLTKLKWNNLSEWEIETILRFLHSGMQTSDDRHNYQDQLKTLPLFETMEDSFESIDMYNVIYILNTQFTNIFPNLYKLDSSCIFLKKTRINTEVSEDLGIQIIDDLQFLMDYILPNIEQIFNDQKLDVVRLLYDIICCYSAEYDLKKEKIVSNLRNIKLIKANSGIFQKVSYFYEKREPLFKIMIPTEKFVPESFFKEMGCYYDDSNLNKLLKDLGIKCSVSSDDFITFALQVSEEVNLHAPLKELIEKSDALITYFCNVDEENLQRDFYEKVADIKFVYPHRVRECLRNLHPPFAEGRHFVALRDSLVKQREEDEELVWASMPILPSKCTLSRNMSRLKAAGAVYAPPESVVITNLRKVCLAPCKSCSALKTRSRVLQTAYGFLQNHSFDVLPLIDLPIVLVEEGILLIRISQVVFSLQNYNDFHPYLYRLPPVLAPYHEFFQKLGVALEPSACHLVQILRSLYEDTGKVSSLNPNQMMTVKRTLYHLFTLLESRTEERAVEKLKPLYLPASDGIMYPSNTLCFNDRISTGSRRDVSVLNGKFNFLLDLGECHLSSDPYKQINLLQFLPEEIRPSMLSQITEEILNESVLCLCSHGDNCTFRNDFYKILVSPNFRGGLMSLLKGQCSRELPVREIEHNCENVFSKMQIICCKKLETILCLGSEQLSDTSIEKQVYTKIGSTGNGMVYLEHRDNVPFSMKTVIIHSLATELNVLLKNALNKDSLLILVLMLSCENPQDIKKVLEEKGINTSKLKVEKPMNQPNPGDPVPEELIHTLEMDIAHHFKAGEYVAYKGSNANDYVYAIFIERINTDNFAKDIKMQRYKIKIGIGSFTTVNHLDLYKFSQQKMPGEICQKVVVQDAPKDKQQTSSQKYESLDSIKKEIHDYLKEVRNLPQDERQKAIRRLYLKWHPDKNPNNTEVTTQLCHFIQEKVKQLDVNRAENVSSSSSYKSSYSSKEEDFSSFFNQWNSEASRHKKSQSQQRKSHGANEFCSFPKKNQSNPEEARRWFRQARCDLRAAHNDLGYSGLDGTAIEWLYFKIHQAVEKALIAAEYKRSGICVSDHSITYLANQVSSYSAKLSDLVSLVNKLKDYGVDSKKTQYPNYHSQPHIPNDLFKSGHEQEVLILARTILDSIEEFIASNT
ncbi:sacsin [Hypanus sabinus]|uniref:sacsin n=1 Tax=Hypanus sabinus TaxID=79690 RepID=UPI0028C47987|nr:sacsin [Hypanus sabinus]